jgi:hypothetical protein
MTERLPTKTIRNDQHVLPSSHFKVTLRKQYRSKTNTKSIIVIHTKIRSSNASTPGNKNKNTDDIKTLPSV